MSTSTVTVTIDIDMRRYARTIRTMRREHDNDSRLRAAPSGTRGAVAAMQRHGRRQLWEAVNELHTHIDAVYADLGLIRQETPR